MLCKFLILLYLIFFFYRFLISTSSGSRNFREGGPRNMKYKPPCSAAIFFGLFVQAGGGGAWPPWSTLDPLLIYRCSALSFSLPSFIVCNQNKIHELHFLFRNRESKLDNTNTTHLHSFVLILKTKILVWAKPVRRPSCS